MNGTGAPLSSNVKRARAPVQPSVLVVDDQRQIGFSASTLAPHRDGRRDRQGREDMDRHLLAVHGLDRVKGQAKQQPEFSEIRRALHDVVVRPIRLDRSDRGLRPERHENPLVGHGGAECKHKGDGAASPI
jgi:hypothetical protein